MFKIYLPRVEAEAEKFEGYSGIAKPDRGTETILLVEDDASVRALASRMLRDQGYKLIEASNGEEGLRAAREFRVRSIY